MAEIDANGKGRAELAGRKLVLDRPRLEGQALLGDAQEPLVHHDIAAEGAVAKELAAGKFLENVRQEIRDCVEAAALTSQAGIQNLAVMREVVHAVVALGGEDGVRGDQARFNCRADAFSALGIRQAGGIADQQHALIDDRAMRVTKQAVGMAGNCVARYIDTASLLQNANEVFYMAGDLVRVGAAESHIEVVVLTEDPAITAHVPAKEQFG